jgi:hypothetical protein
VFGNGCILTPKLAAKIIRWLRPGGVFFFDTYDAGSLDWKVRLRKWARNTIYHILPHHLQERWDQKTGWLPLFLASGSRLRALLINAGFEEVIISRSLCKTPGGQAWKLQCKSIKSKVWNAFALGSNYFLSMCHDSMLIGEQLL